MVSRKVLVRVFGVGLRTTGSRLTIDGQAQLSAREQQQRSANGLLEFNCWKASDPDVYWSDGVVLFVPRCVELPIKEENGYFTLGCYKYDPNRPHGKCGSSRNMCMR